jgi:predicted LPLAT superfamily acyltransferase
MPLSSKWGRRLAFSAVHSCELRPPLATSLGDRPARDAARALHEHLQIVTVGKAPHDLAQVVGGQGGQRRRAFFFNSGIHIFYRRFSPGKFSIKIRADRFGEPEMGINLGDTRRFSFSFDGENYLRDAVAEGRGVLLLTAHLGNWEAAGALLSRLNVPINVTGFDRETAAVRELLNRASKATFRLLPLTGSPTDAIPLVAALRRGEVVAMLGDRPYGSPSAEVPFLGGTAAFPIGAYMLAAIAGAPLVPVFSLSEPGGRYHFFGFPPQRPRLPPHDQRDAWLRDCAARFAADLEIILRRDPLQWYNFFPFWRKPAAQTQPQPGVKLCATP